MHMHTSEFRHRNGGLSLSPPDWSRSVCWHAGLFAISYQWQTESSAVVLGVGLRHNPLRYLAVSLFLTTVLS